MGVNTGLRLAHTVMAHNDSSIVLLCESVGSSVFCIKLGYVTPSFFARICDCCLLSPTFCIRVDCWGLES